MWRNRIITTLSIDSEKRPKVRRLRLYFPQGQTDMRQSEFDRRVLEMRRLTHLELNWYPWRTISAEISDLPRLKDIAIMNSVLADFPWEEWRNPERLRRLALRHTDLTEIRPAISRFRRLTRLDLHEHKFTDLPVEVDRLSRIRDFNIMCTPLSEDCRAHLRKCFGDRVHTTPNRDEQAGGDQPATRGGVDA